MEAYTKVVIMAFLVATAIVSGPTLASGEGICGMSFADVMSCKSAVTADNPLPPTSGCCTALSGADMQCLCKFKKNKMLVSFGIDPTLAMQLPAKCNLLQSVPCV